MSVIKKVSNWAMLIFVVALVPYTASAIYQTSSIGGGAAMRAGGPTPTPTPFIGDILHETFDSAGYDDANWTETGVLDEDDETSPPIGQTGFSGQCLKYSASFSQRYSTWDDGTDRDIVYFSGRYYLTSESQDDGEARGVVQFIDSGSTVRAEIRLYQTGSALYFQFYDQDAATTDETALSAATSYLIEVRWDVTNDVLEFRVDGAQQYINSSFTPGAGEAQFSHFALGYFTGAENTAVMFWDSVDLDASQYPD